LYVIGGIERDESSATFVQRISGTGKRTEFAKAFAESGVRLQKRLVVCKLGWRDESESSRGHFECLRRKRLLIELGKALARMYTRAQMPMVYSDEDHIVASYLMEMTVSETLNKYSLRFFICFRNGPKR